MGQGESAECTSTMRVNDEGKQRWRSLVRREKEGRAYVWLVGVRKTGKRTNLLRKRK
jgi:hypothetical protein